MALLVVGPQLLRFSSSVVFYHRMSRIEYRRCRSVVLLELHDFRISEILFELQYVPYICTSPLVYALVVVADHTYVIVRLCEHLYECVLQSVRILVLIDHYVSEPVLIFQQHSFVLFEKAHCIEKQVVEIHRIVFFERIFVAAVHSRRHLVLDIIAEDIRVFLARYAVLLAFADYSQKI